jgi:hypothetical protein
VTLPGYGCITEWLIIVLAPDFEDGHSLLTLPRNPWALKPIPLTRESSEVTAEIVARNFDAGTLQ